MSLVYERRRADALGRLRDGVARSGKSSSRVRTPRPVAAGNMDRRNTYAEDLAGGIWPHTNRVLPWLVAAFLIMLWLVPFDSIIAPFSVGVDSKLDRVVLVLIVGAWLTLAAGAGRYGPRFKRSPLNVAMLLLLVAVMASVATQLPVLTHLDETTLAIKHLALLLSYLTFFYFVTTVVRPAEVQNFLKFMVILACVTALGTVWEYRFHTNEFYNIAHSLLKGFSVGSPPLSGVGGRPQIVGPTQAPLADATILSIALSFALVFLFTAKDTRKKLLWYAASGLLLAGTFSTQRKSAVLIPVGTLLALTAYSPKRMFRFIPQLLVLLLAIYVIAPHAISGLRYQFETVGVSSSTTHRTTQISGVKPYILTHPVLGRGYGSFDPHKYGVLDNQWLGLLVETGFLGTAAFLGVLLTGGVLAHKATRSRDPVRAAQGVALMGAIAGFAIATGTFDDLSFAQAPYLLMFVLALAVVAADGVRNSPSASEPLPEARRASSLRSATRWRPTPRRRPAGYAGGFSGPLRPQASAAAAVTPFPTMTPEPTPSRPRVRVPVRPPAPIGIAKLTTTAPPRVSVATGIRLAKARPITYIREQFATVALAGVLLATVLGFTIARAPGATTRAIDPSRAAHRTSAPNAGYADALNRIMTKLNKVRSSAGTELARGGDPRSQAGAANALAVGHARAAETLLRLGAGTPTRLNTELVMALGSTANAYTTMARAAKRGDVAAYSQANKSLSAATNLLRSALAQLGKAGYVVGSN